ncbi:hypothetical protein MY1884_006214 [Beauveria asiatica]
MTPYAFQRLNLTPHFVRIGLYFDRVELIRFLALDSVNDSKFAAPQRTTRPGRPGGYRIRRQPLSLWLGVRDEQLLDMGHLKLPPRQHCIAPGLEGRSEAGSTLPDNVKVGPFRFADLKLDSAKTVAAVCLSAIDGQKTYITILASIHSA